jgi:hypothetical protein
MIPFTHKSSRGAPLSRPATTDASTTSSLRRSRGSILGVASDALRFGRRRKSIKEIPPPPPPRLLLPDVIEVRASANTPTFDEDEEAEREQLRAAAVQSVGFDVNISRPPADREHTFGDPGDMNEKEDASIHPPNLPPPADYAISDLPKPKPRSTVRSRERMSSPPALKTAQLASMLTRSISASTPAEVLAFPSTRAQLLAHEQLSATLPKHYPPPSLLMLALSKQWRARHVVLSAPVLAGASYLHIFKSSSPDERELERLEINERSVVFVNDEDVGGRRGVVRVGGVDVGALRRDLNGEENGMTMMMLQIVDANESQNWINAIKNAVLGQRCAFILVAGLLLPPFSQFLLSCRSVRAGLGIPSNSSSVPEPRGDLDVMLSMRMQGMVHSPVRSSFNSSDDTSKPDPNGSSEDAAATPRPPSLRSRPSSPRSQNGVLSLKSLFSVSGSGSRPRSPSLARTTSPDVASGESFGSAASSLLGMRPVADSPLIKPYSMLPSTGPALDPAIQIQRKIIDPQTNLDWAPLENPSKPPLSVPPPPRPMSPSLNPPPPRKRAYTTNEPRQAPSSSLDSGQLVYNHGNASTAGSFGVPVPEMTRPPLERAWSDRGKPRASSVSSNTNSTTTENGSARRWSRQSSNLPRSTLPPDDSPTPVSTIPHPPPWQNNALASHDYERSPSRTSSQSQKTLPSIISSLHVASKRTSTSSSVYSISTTSSNPQHVGAFSKVRALGGSHRFSMPPPRPAPSTALPPTPTGSDTESSATTATPASVKTIRRNSLARRALRLSLGQPVPIQGHPYANDGHPNTAPVTRSHSRSTSVDSVPRSSLSHGLNIPPALLVPPNPPPMGPLPPPPPVTPTPIHAPLPTIPRTTSLKQRLRILSAPSGRSTPPLPSPITTVVHPNLPMLEIPTSMPATPICEPITHIGPDADFLHLDGETPIATVPPKAALGEALSGDEGEGALPVLSLLSFPLPSPPPPPSYGSRRRSLPPQPDRSPQQMTVLSPPPRKGSIRPLPSPSPEQERGQSIPQDDEEMLPLTPPPLDLARNASTLSLSIVSGAAV